MLDFFHCLALLMTVQPEADQPRLRLVQTYSPTSID